MSTKTIVLLRHGQYIKKDQVKNQNEVLSKLGAQQAKLAGKKLKEFKFDQIIHSSMPRAIETAEIVRKELRFKHKMKSSNLLRECVPDYPRHLRKKAGYIDEAKLMKNKRTLEKAYIKFFSPSKKEQNLLLVCHGNVIRFLICKHLGVDTLAWIKMDIQQCAFSVVQISKKDQWNNVVLSHNETGHIPKKMRTFL